MELFSTNSPRSSGRQKGNSNASLDIGLFPNVPQSILHATRGGPRRREVSDFVLNEGEIAGANPSPLEEEDLMIPLEEEDSMVDTDSDSGAEILSSSGGEVPSHSPDTFSDERFLRPKKYFEDIENLEAEIFGRSAVKFYRTVSRAMDLFVMKADIMIVGSG
jgi:hypothetical protein